MTQDITIVTENSVLEALCKKWNTVSALALDTEFIRTDTFYPIPALLQIYDGDACYLIDLTVINNFAPLTQVFKNISVIKILHSCSEDLEVFDTLFQTLPNPLFDTQIAAAFLGYGFSVGYSRLVKTLFNIEPPKDESRSNWLQRPLSDEQVEYAALDVIYLYRIYLNFHKQIMESEKTIWLEESHQELIKNYHSNQQPEHYYQRIKNTWRLSQQQQNILFELCLWREAEARRQNKPRNRILRDEVLFDYAQKNKYPAQYYAIANSSICPKAEIPLPREAGELLKQLKQQVELNANRLNIAPEVLGRKKDLTSFVSSGIESGQYQLPESLCGWRKTIIGETFLNIAKTWHPDNHLIQ